MSPVVERGHTTVSASWRYGGTSWRYGATFTASPTRCRWRRRSARACWLPSEASAQWRLPGRGLLSGKRSRSVNKSENRGVVGVPTLILARTDAEAADILTSHMDERDHAFLTGERTRRGSIGRGTGWTRRSTVPGLRAVRRSDLVRNEHVRPVLRADVRQSHPCEIPGQPAGLQLLTVVQLEHEPQRHDDRAI
jgi:hypothetical protein